MKSLRPLTKKGVDLISGVRVDIQVKDWNNNCTMGTKVRYWRTLPKRPGDIPLVAMTRSEAWVTRDGLPVVLLQGKAGYVHLDHVERILEVQEEEK